MVLKFPKKPPARVAIIGASGYTGAELLRLAACHPKLQIVALGADRNAEHEIADVFPAFRHLSLPRLQRVKDIDLDGIDLVFCALPHGTSQAVVPQFLNFAKCVDLSADFRLTDPSKYEHWYGRPHSALDVQDKAVYGLTEFYRDEIKNAQLVACTGCNAAAGLYALLPLVAKGVIDPSEIVIDLKAGVSGAGRNPKLGTLHSEVSEGCQAYNVSVHRHLGEFDQELSKAAGTPVIVTFTPHLLPQNRGILATIYVRGNPSRIHSVLSERYKDEPFVIVLPLGQHPSTRHVRASNYVHIGVVRDRKSMRAIIFSALDNLTKGSSGQAIQNANLMLGFKETEGLGLAPVVP